MKREIFCLECHTRLLRVRGTEVGTAPAETVTHLKGKLRACRVCDLCGVALHEGVDAVCRTIAIGAVSIPAWEGDYLYLDNLEPPKRKPDQLHVRVPQEPQDPYRVSANGRGCKTCGHGEVYDVVGPDGVSLGTSYTDRDDAEEIAELLSIAWAAGVNAEMTRSAPDATDGF